MKYSILIMPTAVKMLAGISDRRIRGKIADKINQLSSEPEKIGKPLTAELTEYRSLRAVGQRYRIIYQVEKKQVKVLVVALGIRKEGSHSDIYALAKKIIRQRLI